MKKILIGILLSAFVLFVGCENERVSSPIGNKICEASRTCLYLLANGEVFKTVKDPEITGTQQGIIIYNDALGRVNYWSGQYYIIWKS